MPYQINCADLLNRCLGQEWDCREYRYNMETILVVLLVHFLLGGGGWGYLRRRR